ncbi:MAG: hypothetical protein JWM99_5108 [Verrucomicrobiales bacterium]|nr:hypothetical protein [Verrucomicrobiales bacterium]
MTWAVRGCSGYGASAGCLFAGVTWGAAWWFLAHDAAGSQSRRYASGWIILAMAVGISISGNRGWMQWPSFFEGHLLTNSGKGEFVAIPRAYGFLWLFIAGVPWAGIGACLLAWSAQGPPLRFRDWVVRLSCAFGGAFIAHLLFNHYPQLFLPLYRDLAGRYADLHANPNLRRLINDNGHAIRHLGFYLGCLGYEISRRDRKNVILILTVGGLNGIGWAALQNWSWAKSFWPTASFNFWRCWESSAGITIGIAYGVAFYLVNRPILPEPPASTPRALENRRPNLERFGAYLGLLLGLGLSIKNGLKGWANIYLGNEAYWNGIVWKIIGPLLVLGSAGLVIFIRLRSVPRNYAGDLFPCSNRIIWTVLVTQNVLAQLVTGPPTVWNEVVFNIYYLLLFIISAVIVHNHAQRLQRPVPSLK